MSIRLGEWGSSEESEPLVCEGITQQPGPFYNGNFSSSIWGNPPTPPLWRDMPEPNAVCSTSGAQPFGSFSSCQHAKESVFSCKIENTLNGKEEKVSKWAGDFPFRQQAGPHESSSSPFSFGFPPSSPSPASLSSSCAHITLNGSGYSQSHLAGKSVGANSHKDLFNRKSFMVDKGSGQCSNGEKAFSLKELSSKWESILQSQDGPYCSIDSQSPLCNSSIPESSAGLASPKDIKQTPEHSYGKPFANADNVANSLNKEQPVEQHSHGNKFVNADNDANCLLKEQPVEHNYGNPFANADLYSNSLDKMQPLKHTHDNPFTNAGMYATPLHAQRPLFTSIQSAFTSLENCNRKPPLFSQKCDSGTFVFGSCAASGFGANVGLSQQKDACSSAAGSMPRSVITNSKFKKHNTFANKKHSTALGSRAFQSGPSKPSSDTNNSVLKFTMGANSADRSHCPDLANSGHGPASNLQNICASAQNNSFSFGANKTGSQAPSFSSVAARIVTEDTHPSGSSLDGNLFQQRNKNQYAQSIGNKFSTWHPFLQEERSIKTCGLDKGFVGVTSSDGTSSWNNSHKVHEKWEASGIKAGFSHEELPKPSLVKNRTFEGSKLAEFDLNSPNNLSAEDLREKAAKWVRPGEEIKRQKENQEPNFVFGSQKASGPFVFSASRTSGSMKHATLSTDDMNKKEWRSKGNKESKVLEHLIDKLGERMASLGKSHTTQSNHAAYREETVAEGMKEFDASSKGSWTKVAKGSLHAADIFEKNIALSHSIEELREQLAKLGRCGNEINEQKAKAGQVNSSLCGNSIALEHAVKELCEQISKLGKFGEVKEEDTAGNSSSSASEAQHAGSCDNSAIMHAVEELSEQIAKLGRAVRGNDQCDCSYGKAYPSGIKQQSAQDLCKKMATPGKLDKEENNHNMSPESMSTPHVIKGQGAFVFSACNATTSEKSGSIPFHWSKTYASDSRGASFNNTAQFNPSSTVSQSTLFPSNAFAGTQSSSYLNPFTAGQASPFAGIHNGAKFSFYEMPSYSNAAAEGSPQKVFEFHGIKEPPSGTTMNRKNGRACPNMCRRDKKNVTRKNKSSVLQGKIHSTSSAHSTGSPMDSSPYADQNASSPNFGSNKTEQDPGWKSPGPNFVQAESISVEELRMATSNLTLGKEDESRMGDQEKSRSFEHQSDQSSPFVLHQKKGTWKRASRNKSNANLADSKMQFTSGPKTASSGACGIDKRGAEGHTHNSFSGEGFNQRSSSVFADNSVRYTKEMPVRKSMWNQGSSVINGKGENITPVFASTKPNQSLRFDKLGKEQKASLSGELPATPTGTRTATSEQVCENWRLRGNQAYAKGDYEKAEDCYTRGVGSVLPMDTSQSCIRASMLCYSNRAATRMAVGRMREALEDCKRAMMLDSGFLRVRLRAASCHLALGENTAAAALFAECWNCAKESNCSDVKIMEEAMEGMRKSQRFGDLSERALKLCQGESSTDASAALNLLNEALLICPFSEALLELKAQTLFSARRFEDALQLCQQTLPAAEENIAVEQHPNQLGAKANVSLNLWRWRMCGKCFFHLGRLEESASLLTKYEEATCRISFNMAANIESMAALLSTICNLLQHKASGNEAFQAGRHDEAIEHYTAALACNGESRPYNAVCFCNRAAASQALGHIADAIADCSRAIVLDSHYAKAISRRATLHEMVGDYGQTCNDLRRLIALLEGQETCLKSPKSTRAGSKSAQDLRQARDRLEKATKELKKDCAVDHYLILGLDVSCSSNEIKKAYRKAALKHHPDKACQVLVRGENSDDGSFWKEIGDEARRDAERLFKLIGEAYATLSDPTKRSQYDFENHVPRARNPTHAGYGSADDNFSPGEKSGRRQRERREWHSSRYYRWQSGPDAAQPDTYSERGSRDSSASKDGRNKGRRSDFYW